MADASFEVLYAVIGALRADATIAGFVSARIYDMPPQGTLPKPYVTLGTTDTQRTDVTCISAREVYVQVDVWSSGADAANSSAECRKIAGAIEGALHHEALALTANRLVSIEHRNTQVFMDADNATHHGVVQFVAYVETP